MFRPSSVPGWRRALAVASGAAAFTLALGAAHAVPFSAIKPPSCASGWSAEQPYNYQAPSANSWASTVVKYPVCPPNQNCALYADNIDYTRHLVGNAWTSRVSLRVDRFEMENGYDFLEYGDYATLSTTGTFLTGTLTNTPFWIPVQIPTTTGSLQSRFGALRFATDYSVNMKGVGIGSVRVCSDLSSMDTKPPAIMPMNIRHTGVLLGAGDVIYMQLETPPKETMKRGETVTLWTNNGDVDFDLYARCGGLPSQTQWDWQGVSNDGQEFINVGEGCAANTPLYLAVFSYRGAGSFNIIAHQHYIAAAYHDLRVGVESNDPADAQTAAYRMDTAAKDFFGSTEGNQLIGQVDIYTTGSCKTCGGAPCDVCFRTASAGPNGETGNSPRCQAGMINIYLWAGEVVAHELGHRFFCTADEYYKGCGTDCSKKCSDPTCAGGCKSTGDKVCRQCGHSIMNGVSPPTEVLNMCTDFDHGTDTLSNVGIVTSLKSARRQAYEAHVGTEPPGRTPDLFDYGSLDFNYQIGNVTIH